VETQPEQESLPGTEAEAAEEVGYAAEAGPSAAPAPAEAPSLSEQETWLTGMEEDEADDDTWIMEPAVPSDAETLRVETEEPEEDKDGQGPPAETLPFDFE
jgi:hypothetical protein